MSDSAKTKTPLKTATEPALISQWSPSSTDAALAYFPLSSHSTVRALQRPESISRSASVFLQVASQVAEVTRAGDSAPPRLLAALEQLRPHLAVVKTELEKLQPQIAYLSGELEQAEAALSSSPEDAEGWINASRSLRAKLDSCAGIPAIQNFVLQMKDVLEGAASLTPKEGMPSSVDISVIHERFSAELKPLSEQFSSQLERAGAWLQSSGSLNEGSSDELKVEIALTQAILGDLQITLGAEPENPQGAWIQAMEFAEAAGDLVIASRISRRLASLFVQKQSWGEAQVIMGRFAAMANNAEVPRVALQAFLRSAEFAARGEDRALMIEQLDTADALAQASEDPALYWRTVLSRAACLHTSGAADEAITCLNELLDGGDLSLGFERELLSLRSRIYSQEQNFLGALGDLDRVRQLSMTPPNPTFYSSASFTQVDVLAQLGRHADALERLLSTRSTLKEWLGPKAELSVNEHLSRLRARWGEATWLAANEGFAERMRRANFEASQGKRSLRRKSSKKKGQKKGKKKGRGKG